MRIVEIGPVLGNIIEVFVSQFMRKLRKTTLFSKWV